MVAIVEKVKGHVTKAAQVEGSVDQALVERATMLAVARFLAFLRPRSSPNPSGGNEA